MQDLQHAQTPMNLYLVRHALPEAVHYDNRYPGPNIGAQGNQQAAWIARFLASRNITQVWASDYPRVLQTMAPFLEIANGLRVHTTKALWEREASVEAHECLVKRVHDWFSHSLHEIRKGNTAIFSHCGPINMILEYLDPAKTQLRYPYVCPHGCHTPCAGIWEINLSLAGIQGRLIIPGEDTQPFTNSY
jgi:broad specificity phosphatase PhoE